MIKAKESKAITLIALIITIIILIILSGVVINLSIGNNGIIKQAKKSVYEIEKSEALEELKIIIIDIQIEQNGNAKIIDVVRKLKNDKDYYILGEEETSTGCNIEELNENISQIYLLHNLYKFKIDNKLRVTLIKDEGVIELSELQKILIECNLSISYTNEDLKNNKDDILIAILKNEKGLEYILKNDEICRNINLDYILNTELISNISENNRKLLRDKPYILETIITKDNSNELLNSLNFTPSVPILDKSDDCIFSSIYTNTGCWPKNVFDRNGNTYWCTEYNKR